MKTIQEIYDNSDNLYQAINDFLAQVTYPETPVRPRKPSGDTAAVYAEYAEKLAVYEEQMLHYRYERDQALAVKSQLEDELSLFLIELSGWKDHPKADNAWAYAWQEGHSSGYYEVYVNLCDLYEYFA